MVGEDWVRVKVVEDGGVSGWILLGIVEVASIMLFIGLVVIGREQEAEEPPLEPVQDQREWVEVSVVLEKVPVVH